MILQRPSLLFSAWRYLCPVILAGTILTVPAQEPAPTAGESAPAAGSVYARLEAEFSRYPHRIVGSTNLANSFAALEKEFAAVGLESRYQTFDTLVQKTERASLSYGDADVPGILPLDYGVASWVRDEPVSAPAIYVGNGVLGSFDGLEIADRIAVIDITLPLASIQDVFMQGALAAILVGDDSVSQWNAARIYNQSGALVPCVYLDRENATNAGLLEADGTSSATIDVRTRLVDTEGASLYVVLPGEEGWEANLGSPEAIILSATLDTYGFTPDYSPDQRRAANAALLADVVCRIAATPRKRTVVAVFFGGSYGGLEATRHFYQAVDMADKGASGSDFSVRQVRLGMERDDTERLLAAIVEDDVIDEGRGSLLMSLGNLFSGLFGSASEESAMQGARRDVSQRFKRALMAHVNRQRDPLGRLNSEHVALSAELARLKAAAGKDPASAARLEELTGRLAALQAQIDEENDRKRRWNNLQGQVATRKMAHDDPESVATFNEIRDEIVVTLERRQREIASALRHNQSGIELSNVFSNQMVVGHFDFDFADADKPWFFSVINAYGLYRSGVVDTGSYLPHLTRLGEIYEDSAAAIAGPAPLYTPALTPFYKPFSLSVPNQRQVPSIVGVSMGIAGFQLMSLGNPLNHDAMPRRDNCDLSPLADQMTAFCSTLAIDERLSLRRVFTRSRMEERFTYLRGPSSDTKDIAGVNFIDYARASSDSEGPSQNAVAVFHGFSMADLPAGQSFFPRTRILSNGYMYMPMVSRNVAITGWRARILGFGYDDAGRLDRVAVEEDASGVKSAPIPLFHAHGGVAFSYGYAPDPLGGDLYVPKTLIARKDAAHKNFCNIRFGWGPAAFYADREDPIKRIGANGEIIIGATADNPMGEGISIAGDALLGFNGIARGAYDYWQLNDMRLRVLRQRNIVNDDLETLHAEVREHLDSAEEETGKRNWLTARAHHIFATSLANRVYSPLRGVTEDLVHAVVVLLLLNIPFAFAMERLIFGFTSIYKQVIGFVGFFLATFGVLFVTHPAFSLASAPIIIFLAFVIILLASLTIAIVMGKIRQEIRAIQGLASTVHGVESDSSTSMAAVLIGISGMRNRPLKTFLTSITVVLLTFTILVFASFTSRQGVVETYLGKGHDEDRIELHRFSFLDISKPLVTSIETLYGDRFHVFRRGGVFRNPTRGTETGVTPLSPDRVLHLPRTGKTAALGTLMGIDPAECEFSSGLAELAPGFAETDTPHPPIFLPELVAQALEAEVGDVLLLNGQRFSFAGTTVGAVMQNLSTIDDFKISPPDFASTVKNTGRSASDGMGASQLESMDSGSFEWFSPDNIGLARMADLERVFTDANYVNFILMYPRTAGLDIEKTGHELAPVFHGAVHVKSSEGARRLFFTKAVEGSGFGDVLVPLLLGGLIIFSSLMGSIVDREREIFTYSALGLAPPDVGALFFAESAVYSVIGGMGGYLVSQVVAKILNTLGRMGVMTPPEMNFSSLTSVLTILIVMLVVMLSTIFPALKAGRSANPGVARRWKMPQPEGNHMRFVFPFTVSELDFTGILSFIREHFGNHSDATLGSFAAKEVRLFRLPGAKGGKDAIGIEANISLAPFDLGIFQRFRMYSSEFEIEGIDEVVVELERIGGTPASWVRSNRAFADELRQQFLLWRSLPIETIEHYRAQTAATLGEPQADEEQPQEEPVAES